MAIAREVAAVTWLGIEVNLILASSITLADYKF